MTIRLYGDHAVVDGRDAKKLTMVNFRPPWSLDNNGKYRDATNVGIAD
jgi:hypothetical protein